MEYLIDDMHNMNEKGFLNNFISLKTYVLK